MYTLEELAKIFDREEAAVAHVNFPNWKRKSTWIRKGLNPMRRPYNCADVHGSVEAVPSILTARLVCHFNGNYL